MCAASIEYSERSLGALYFSFGVGMGMLALRLGIYDEIIAIFGFLSLEQAILLNIFIGSFVGSVLYNLRIDLSVEWASRRWITGAFMGRRPILRSIPNLSLVIRRRRRRKENHALDIAYVTTMYHAWESVEWESLENDIDNAIRDAVNVPAVQSILHNIKAGIFSSISVLLTNIALFGIIPTGWFWFLIAVAIVVIVLPFSRYWDTLLIVNAAKMKWYVEGIKKIIHIKESGDTYDIGISPEKALKLGVDVVGVLEKGEIGSFKRQARTITQIIRKFGHMTSKRYVDSVLCNYAYRAFVRDHTRSTLKSKVDNIKLYKEIRKLFEITGGFEKSKIDWKVIYPEKKKDTISFFKIIPLESLGGYRVLGWTELSVDIRTLIEESTDAEKIEYLNAIGDTHVRFKSTIPSGLRHPLFELLNDNPELLKNVFDSIIAVSLWGGIDDKTLQKCSVPMVQRIVTLTESPLLKNYISIGFLENVLLSLYRFFADNSVVRKIVFAQLKKYRKLGMKELVEFIKIS